MELKVQSGFKKTELGVIPMDWSVERIEDIATIQRGKFTPRPRNNPIYYGGDIPFVQTGDVTKSNGIISQYSQTLNKKGLEVSKLFGKGTILMTIAANIGYTGILEMDMACPDSLIGINGINSDNRFLNYYFQWKRILIEELSTSGAQKNLNIELFRPFKIPLPPTIEEQQAIANALSDVDALIASLDTVIAKKKAIKKGAMQQLLTPPSKGGKRLPGFEGEWVEVLLDEVAWYQEGPGLRKWQFTKSGIKVINITNLVGGYLDLERTQRHISYDEFNRMYKHFEIDEHDILVASSGNSYCKTSVVRKKDLPLVMNTSVIRFKPKPNLDYNMLLVFLKSNLFKDQIDLLITGGAQPNFGPYHLGKILIQLPPTREEQEAIGIILSDMDKEIEALETKKEKYIQIKQGMAQELLTGKTRLV